MPMKRVVLASVVLTLVLAACGTAITEQLIESQEGVGNVEIDENSGSVVIEFEDEEGETSAVIGGGELPADFPIPVPDGGDVVAVVDSGGDQSASITYPSSEFNDIKDFYANWVASAGEELNKFESSSPPSVSWSIQDGDSTYSVSVVDTGSEVFVTILVVSTGG
jgi:hypothetical protein